MIKLTRELKTGVVAIVAIAMLIWGYNFLKGQNILVQGSEVYYVMFDNVEGLDESSDVTVNGHKVGSVLDITFQGKSHGGLKVTFDISEDFDLSKNDEILMYSSSMLGSKDLKIIPVYDGDTAPADYLFQGYEEEDLITALTKRIAPIEESLSTTLASMNETFTKLNDVMDDQTRDKIKGSVAELNQTLVQVKQMTAQGSSLDKSLQNVEVLSGELTEFSSSLNELDLQALNASLTQNLDQINKVLVQLEHGQGTAGKLLNDPELYNNLSNATKELEELLRDVKENPKRFVHFSVFGKKSDPYTDLDTID